MTPLTPIEPTDQQLIAFGYAPGGYMSKCLHCDAVMHDLDKRATSCRPCAVKRFHALALSTLPVGVDREAIAKIIDPVAFSNRLIDPAVLEKAKENALEKAEAILALLPAPATQEGKILAPFNPCLAKLREGEPFFVLLGRDKQAPEAVDCWAIARAKAEGKSDWTEQAHEVANAMRAYSGAPATQGVPEGFVLVPQAAIDWLNGAGPDHNGDWFDPSMKSSDGKYWWRSHFREVCAAFTSPLPPAPGAETDPSAEDCAKITAAQVGDQKLTPLSEPWGISSSRQAVLEEAATLLRKFAEANRRRSASWEGSPCGLPIQKRLNDEASLIERLAKYVSALATTPPAEGEKK